MLSAQPITVSAPGSIMLLGEHAVLRDYAAVVCAINRRLQVTLTPRTDNIITIVSDALGSHKTTIEDMRISAPFGFVLAALQQMSLSEGCDITITSQFSDQVGLGSSAAVTVAVVAAVRQWQFGEIDLDAVYDQALAAVHTAQGMGSGADVAASVFGGTLLYRKDPVTIQKLPHDPKVSLVYVGYKVPTAEVVAKVNAQADALSSWFSELFAHMGDCTGRGVSAIRDADWPALASVFEEHQALQQAIGVSNADLMELIAESVALPEILAAKISGSGLGDCIVTLGVLPKAYFPMNEQQQQQGVQQIDVAVECDGCRLES